MASPHKSLYIWVKHFFGYLAYEIFFWPESWRGSLYVYPGPFYFPYSGLYLLNGFHHGNSGQDGGKLEDLYQDSKPANSS